MEEGLDFTSGWKFHKPRISHQKAKLSVDACVIKGRGWAAANCPAGVKTNNGHTADWEASPDPSTPPKATLKWDRWL